MNPGSETFHVTLSRDGPSMPWGFRLQGGADFSTALSIQSVNPGSIAENCGLRAGDAVLQINSRSSDELEHEQAKQEIVASGNTVTLLLQRGAVKIWKPKVTPMSELAPVEIKLIPDGATDNDRYVQKTSLAADKMEVLHIGSGYNRSARPFTSGPSSGPTNTYNTPIKLYSANNVHETESLQTGVQGLTVHENVVNRAPSPTQLMLSAQTASSSTEPPAVKRQPAFLTPSEVDSLRGRSPVRSVSPTLIAVQGLGSGGLGVKQSAVYQDVKDGEEVKYQGFTNPHKQSRSFHMLEHGLGVSDGVDTGPTGGQTAVSGIRSVKAPTYDPSQHQVQQSQHSTCKICGALIIGVFVRVKGDPLHPECFKCVKCGKNLKNQGYFTVEGQMYCESDAKQLSNPNDPDSYAVPVYRKQIEHFSQEDAFNISVTTAYLKATTAGIAYKVDINLSTEVELFYSEEPYAIVNRL